MVIVFAMWFDARGHATVAGRGTRHHFTLCQKCDTVTHVPDIRFTTADGVTDAPRCAVCEPMQVPA